MANHSTGSAPVKSTSSNRPAIVDQQIAYATEGIAPPEPLPKHSVETPELKESLLPEVWRPWIVDAAERLQCPPDYTATAAIVAAAALIGNRIRIKPKQNDSWLVVPNLWGAVVGVPGDKKTPAVNEGLIFFREIEESERIEFDRKSKDAEFDREYADARRSELRKSMRGSKADKDSLRRSFHDLEVKDPIEKTLSTCDVTVEKLGELLNENPDGLLISRDELTGFLRMLDRSGHEQDRSFYLETWNGDGTFTFHRIGRGRIHVKNTTVSILGTIQPAMIEPYLRSSLEGGNDDGLIQRFQILVYPERSQNYQYVDRKPKGRDVARESFRSLYRMQTDQLNFPRLTDDSGGHRFLQFDDEAQEFFKTWLSNLENLLRSGEIDSPALESHLAKYRSLMPTLALIFFLLDRVTNQRFAGQIGLEYAELAAEWCSFLQGHAKKLYSMASLSDLDAAEEILKRIKARNIEDKFTARDIYTRHWKHLSKPEDVKTALDLLCDYGYLFALPDDTGGRPKTRYYFNPAIDCGLGIGH